MKCPQSDKILLYISNEMDSTSYSEMKSHVEECEACRAELERLSETESFYSRVPLERAPEISAEAFASPVARGINWKVSWTSIAAAIILSLAIGLLMSSGNPTTKPTVGLGEGIARVVQKNKDDYAREIIAKQNEIRKTETRWRRDTDKQVTLELNNIEKKRDQIRLQQELLEIARQRIEELELKAEKLKDNTEKIIKQRDILLQDNRTRDDIFLFLYATTIQQNMTCLTQLRDKIYNIRTGAQVKKANVEELKGDIDLITTGVKQLKLSRTDGLQTKINDIKTQISELTSKKGNISNITVIQNPEVSLAPVKSKKKQMILLSVVVGLFFMIFLAFFIEYIKNVSKPSSCEKGR